MATISIDADNRLRSDSRQWIHERITNRVDKETGERVWKQISFHSEAGLALKSLAHRLLRESDAEGIGECIDTMNRICTALTDALRPHININLEK